MSEVKSEQPEQQKQEPAQNPEDIEVEEQPNQEPEQELKKEAKLKIIFEPSKELVRKSSRVVLHAAEKHRKPLFERLTDKNADRIAQITKERPIFYEEKEGAETKIILDPEIADLMPPEFFENPTKWIESQPNIERKYKQGELPTGETIEELWQDPYDVSKVKEFSISLPKGKKLDIISKRIESEETEEIVLAVKAMEAGIPTPRVFGEVSDKGNLYAFFEKIEGIDLLAAKQNKNLENLFNDVSTLLSMKEGNFDLTLKSFRFINFISEDGCNRLFRLWHKANKEFIEEKEISRFLKEIIYFFTKYNDINRALERVYNLEDYFYENTLNKFFKKYGYRGFRDFKKFEKSIDRKRLEDLAMKLEENKSMLKEKSNDFIRKAREIVLEDVLGVNIENVKEKLKQMCKENGIEHKDFADRNILIEWDFEKDEPKGKGTRRKPKLYIIDWEAKSSLKEEKDS